MQPLLIASSYAPHVGGVEEVVARLADGMRRRASQPLVATNHWPRALPTTETIEDVPVLRVPFRVPHRSIRGLAGWALGSLPTRRAMVSAARAHDTDVVNIHCVSSNGSYALATAKALAVPLVVSLHGELGNDANAVYRHDTRLVRTWHRLIDRAGGVTAPSQFVLDEAQEFYGASFGGRSSVIRNGVDLDLFGGARRPDDRPFAFAIGRLVRPKGFDVLVDAWAASGLSDIDLVIGGDGPERADLERRTSATGGRVRLVGQLDRVAVAEYLSRATMFVLPSHAEPLGLTMLEAMAARAPVVATAAGGVPELIEDGRSGILVEPGSAEALAQGVQRVLDNPKAAEVRAAVAATFVARLSWSACVDAYMDAYAGAGVVR